MPSTVKIFNLGIIAGFTLLFAGFSPIKPEPPIGAGPWDGYELVWADEFNQDGQPDKSRWTYDIGRGDNGWGNQELQYYTDRPENVTCKDGYLTITTWNESYRDSEYTSTRMKTLGRFSFRYGILEIRAKLPGGTGIWPALWMLGDNFQTIGWPSCGEIDMMEYAGKNKDLIHGSLHSPSSFGGTINTKTTIIKGVEDEFHIYSLEWTEKDISFMVDGNCYYTYSPDVYTSDTWPFDKPFFIIMNVAVGGGFGGPLGDITFPCSMTVDYVKVYQKVSQ
jgi:beta-glucanase (GH16 family)